MLSINLTSLLVGSLLVSAVLMILNRRRVGVAGSAAATIAVCLILALIEFRPFATGAAVRYWLLFQCMPSAVVFGLSRSSLLRRRAWLLLLLGPVTFVMAVVVVVSILNMVFPQILSP